MGWGMIIAPQATARALIGILTMRQQDGSQGRGGSVYLVTGGGGFIGSHLVRALARRGERVGVLENGFSGGPERLGDVLADIEWIVGDIRDVETLTCDVCKSLADISLQRATLGYEPIVPLGTGLAQSVAVFAIHESGHAS
jgi:nucleoside-diphosphate-sugar epimerase